MEQIAFDFDNETKRKRITECKCPHCGHVKRTYVRSVNSNMAMAAIILYRYSKGEFVKVEDLLLEKGYKRCGDFSYLKWYNIIKPMKEIREDGSDRNGKYRLTSFGAMWVEGKVKIKEKFIICENELLGFEGDDIDIQTALGEKFNYAQLISESNGTT